MDVDSCCFLREMPIFIPQFKIGNFAERKKKKEQKDDQEILDSLPKWQIEIHFLVSVASTHNYIDVGLIEVCVVLIAECSDRA